VAVSSGASCTMPAIPTRSHWRAGRLRRCVPPVRIARRCLRRCLALPPAPLAPPARRGYGCRTSMPVVGGTGVGQAQPGQGSYAPSPRPGRRHGKPGDGTALRRRPWRVGGTAMAPVAPWWTVCPSCRYRRVRVPARRCRQSAWYGMPGVGTALRRRPRRVGGTAMAPVAPWWTVCPSCWYRRVRVPARRCRQSA